MKRKFTTIGYIIGKHKLLGYVRKHKNGFFFYVPRTEEQSYRRSRLFYTQNKVATEAQDFMNRRYGVSAKVFFEG